MVEYIADSGVCVVFTYEKGVGIREEIVMATGDTFTTSKASFGRVCQFLRDNTTYAFTYGDVFRALIGTGPSIHIEEV